MELLQDEYERKAMLLANEKGFYNFSFEEREDDYDEDEYDEDFDEFYNLSLCGKKCQERRRQREAGLSRKEARQNVRDMKKGKEARHDLPDGTKPTGVQDLSKRTFLGNAIAVTTMAVPRSSFLSLMLINFRVMASRLAVIKNDPRYKTKWDQAKTKWQRLGGKVSTFENVIEKGKNKKPFFCGAKCKAKGVKSNAAGVDDAAVGVWVAIGSAVVGAMATIIGTVQAGKGQEAQIKLAEENAKNEYN